MIIDRAYGNYPDLSGVRRVLVIVLKNIGDVLLSTPVFTALKHHIPGVRIDALVNGGTEDMLAGNPNIEKIHVLDRKALKGPLGKIKGEISLLKAIRSAGFDMVIALSSGDRSRNLALLSGAPLRVGPASGKKKALGIFNPINITVNVAPARRHYVERNLDCLRRIGIFPEESLKRTLFFEGEEASGKVRGLLSKAGVREKGYIVVHPTSRWMFKCWPPEKVAELIDRVQRELKTRVVLTSAPDPVEKKFAGRIISALKTEAVDFSCILSLRELGALIRGARAFFGVDSAPMHMAAAVGTPAVAIFGPTSVTDWAPWGEGHTVITSERHGCVPCGRDGCGGSKVSDCIVEISVEKVFQAIRRKIEGVNEEDIPRGRE